VPAGKADHVAGTCSIPNGVVAYHGTDTSRAIRIAALLGDAPIGE